MPKKTIYFIALAVSLCSLYFSCSLSDKKGNETIGVTTDFELVQLGRYLFYDRRLSVNETKACATCHAQEFSFTDSYKKSVGALGDNHQRNSKPLINLLYNKYYTAGDSNIKTLLQQMQKPMFNTHPIEMGFTNNEDLILNRIKNDKQYQKLFSQVFGDYSKTITVTNIQIAIEAFEKTIVSFDSKYDKYVTGDSNALNANEKKGMQLFFSSKLKCINCHNGKTFTEPIFERGGAHYNNIGLRDKILAEEDNGLFELTKNENDRDKFKTPTLRNLAFTAPYFHDGSASTLNEVISVYESGGRIISNNSIKSKDRKNENKSNLINGFKLTLAEKNNLVSFLLALSDSTILKNEKYSNPFIADETKKQY